MPPRSTFDHELELMNIDLIKMGSMIENAIENSINAFKNHDNEAAQHIIESDSEINALEKRIESTCLSLILRQQPVAGDLRKISTALKMITDMERIGDNASDIAELTMRITGEHIYEMVKHIPPMAQEAAKMVHDSISAFVNSDLDLAEGVIKRDDIVDDLFNVIKIELIEMLKDNSQSPDNVIDYLMIAKYLEKIGDHAVNICEWVEFCETGEHKIKVKKMNNA